MNLKLKTLSAGAIFFITGGYSYAQKDSIKTKTIDEVVVVGYQKKKADEIIQAQSTITNAEMKQQSPTLTMANMLQGKAPGVMVQTSSGQPGSTGFIQIRGIGNLSNSQPLIVIDGLYSSVSQYNALNPSEVESQTILKDAAATAQYGSRAANGVIVVTTRRGVAGRTDYSFETRMGFSQKVSDKELNFEMMNATQKLDYENQLGKLGVAGQTPYSDAQYSALAAQGHNWQDDILRNSAETSYLFTARGGDKKNIFYYSLGHDTNTGIIRYLNGLKRYNARFNFENQLSDRVRFGINTAVMYQETQNQRDRNNGQNPIKFMYGANPYETIYNADGTYNPTKGGTFPILEALRTNTGKNKNLRFTGVGFGEVKIFDYLKFRSTLSTTYNDLVSETITLPGSYLDVILGQNGSITKNRSNNFNYVVNNRFDFTKTFGLHKVNALAFYEFSSDTNDFVNTNGKGYRSPGFNQLSNLTTPVSLSGYQTKVRRTGLALLADYAYDQRYLLSASIRRDGSSRFGLNSQYGVFWSASAGWNIAKEKFMENSIFNSLKLRGSYGIAGNDDALADYVNQLYVSFGLYGTGATTYPGNSSGVIGNNDIKWEEVKITNLGIDFGLVNNRFRGSIEVFENRRNNFIQQVSQPSESGWLASYENQGDLRNRGIEAELSADVIRNNDFTWNLRGNISSVENKLLALAQGQTQRDIGDNTLIVGETPYLFKMVKSAGINPANGDALYYTNRTTAIDPSEVITKTDHGNVTNFYSSTDEQVIYGKSPFPKLFGGFGTSFTYKNFDVSADFSYKFGGYMINYMALNMLDPSQASSNKRVDAINFWRNPGDANVLPKPTDDGLYLTDYFLQKSDYVKLRSLNIGYTFDREFLGDKVPIHSLRVFIQGQNLYTWTKYEGDPEVAIGSAESNSNTTTAFVPNSYSLYTYPSVKSYFIGFQLEF